jgi:hypothetical protein
VGGRPILTAKREHYSSARRRIEARRGRPADFIRGFESLQPGETVDLWVAVSGSEQKRDQNLKDAEAWLRLKVRERGALVGNVARHVVSRYAQFLPRALWQAALEANRQGRNLLAESVDRFIRHPHYRSNLKPHLNFQVNDKFDLEALREHTCGAELVTWLDPSATAEEVRSHQRIRGQWGKSRRGGRPRKHHRKWKARRERLAGSVRRLHAKGVNSYQIWRKLESRGEIVTYHTVRNWVRQIAHVKVLGRFRTY